MQNLNMGKVCLVSDAVAVGLVGGTVIVGEMVGENVTVAVSTVDIAVEEASPVGVDVFTAGGGAENDLHANATRRRMPMTIYTAYLRSADASIAVVRLNGVTSGALPVNPSGDKRDLNFSSYSPAEKLTKLIVFSAKGTLHGTNMIGMIFLRRFNACVYSLRTHSDSMELGERTTIIYLLSAIAAGMVRTQSSPPRRSVMSHQTS